MQTCPVSTAAHAKVFANAMRARWDIERDVIRRGRRFDCARHFLPSGLSLVDERPGPHAADERLMGQVQGRNSACIFGVVKRYSIAEVWKDVFLTRGRSTAGLLAQ